MKTPLVTLPLGLLATLQNATTKWNIVKVSLGKSNAFHSITENDTLKIFYPKGSFSPSQAQGGIGFFASPLEFFPSKEVRLSYQVRFDETFDPIFGGKLPGLFIGKGLAKEDMKGASGGDHNNSSSIRIAWRKNFDAEAYVYVPNTQHPQYYQMDGFVHNNVYGDSLWRSSFAFQKTNWNQVNLRVKVNDFRNDWTPKPNGELEVTINNTTRKFTKLIWTTSPDNFVTAILFETFFGGSTSKYATQRDTWSYFKNVQIQSLQ